LYPKIKYSAHIKEFLPSKTKGFQKIFSKKLASKQNPTKNKIFSTKTKIKNSTKILIPPPTQAWLIVLHKYHVNNPQIPAQI